jgi:hypothetical protein
MLAYHLFERLPSWSQIDVLRKSGTQLAHRQHLDWTITLYAFQHQFVEVWRREGLELVTSFRPQVNTLAILEPYTEHLEIGDMMD